MNHFQYAPLAISAGLLMPVRLLDKEPRLTDAGMFFTLGALAHDDETGPVAREFHRAALDRVLTAAKKGGFDDQAEALLLAMLSHGVDPLGANDQGRLLAILCRLVSLSVGRGRMGALIAGKQAH